MTELILPTLQEDPTPHVVVDNGRGCSKCYRMSSCGINQQIMCSDIAEFTHGYHETVPIIDL